MRRCERLPDGLCLLHVCEPATNCGVAFLGTDDLVSTTSSCSYVLNPAPLDSSDLYVYFEEVGSDPPVRRRIERYVSWNYAALQQEIDFVGTACDELESGAVTPIVVIGCGGCPGGY